MGRTKEFDPDVALRAAMELFWRQGYEGTSMQDLVDHLGVNRASIYATFGGKHELYLRALDHYAELTDVLMLSGLSKAGPVLPEVRALVRRYVQDSLQDKEKRGCLVTNTVVELLPADAVAGRRAELSLDGLEMVLASALTRAQAQGELAESRDPRGLARFLVTFLQGVRVIAKTPDPRRLLDAERQALSLLD
ncbi:TetR/AcrR family transcriptional regulator [Crossiella cryophila]|uniref:TetR/AcrR family transcriptional repressor of nem operon n=1 Tax=Crossiella cryophila TaxID=43355 RepID=A0A7W7CDV4_9PSEU|nr:TetR/AcrR family transcriptional regulator [Crossiella cryophila]MBB4677749.1 TetR/AcrR family transcriptional repressor of nem operon [Crossiella cryophila]